MKRTDPFPEGHADVMIRNSPATAARSGRPRGWAFRALALAVIPAVVGSAFAAFPPHQEDRFLVSCHSAAEGLSQDSITAVAQDHQGFLWIGTAYGLNRFDGYRFVSFKHRNFDPVSLHNNVVSSLFIDHRGDLWVGMAGGLDRFDRETGHFVHFHDQLNLAGPLPTSRTTAIAETPGFDLWVGTTSGIFRRRSREERFTPCNRFLRAGRPEPVASVAALACDDDGRLLAATSRGLYRFEGDWFRPIDEVERVVCDVHGRSCPSFRSPLNCIQVVSPHGMRTGGLLEVTEYLRREDGGLSVRHIPLESQDPQFPGPSQVYAIREDDSGDLWVATERGLYQIPAASGAQTPVPLTFSELSRQAPAVPISFRSLYRDRSGVIWAGTYGKGLFRIVRKPGFFNSFRPSDGNVTGQSVQAAYEDRAGNLWLGTDVGAFRFGAGEKWVSLFPMLRENEKAVGVISVKAFCEERDGRMLIGTIRGLVRLDASTGRIELFRKPEVAGMRDFYVRCLLADRSGKVWVGTRHGLFALDPKDPARLLSPPPSVFRPPLSGAFIYSLMEDRKGCIWVGTVGEGLFRLEPAAGGDFRVTPFRHDPRDPHGLSDGSVLCIAEDRRGFVWVGTTEGLNRIAPDGEIQHFYEEDGLPNSQVYSILEDRNGSLWMSTNKGVSCLNPGAGTFLNYYAEDGLQNNEFNGGAACVRRSGEMVMGGITGVSLFNPGALSRPITIPPVALTDFRLLAGHTGDGDRLPDRPGVRVPSLIDLGPAQNAFSIGFSVLDFVAPENNTYAYRMEGVDRDWVLANRRNFATYSNLSPGTYTFRIIGANSRGIWNQSGATLMIVIHPPFYETPAFIVLVALLAVVLVLGAFHLRARSIRQRMEGERLRSELRLKADFTAMIIHELRTPLSCIFGFAKLLHKRTREERCRESAGFIIASSERMIGLINDMLDLSKYEAGKMPIAPQRVNPDTVVESVLENLRPLGLDKEIRFLSVPGFKGTACMDPSRIGQVVTNLIGNAIKHSPPRGTVTVSTRPVKAAGQDCLEFSVQDQGAGIPPEKVPLLFNKYAQLDSDEPVATKGTGLGLAISRLIVEAHRGTIGYRPVTEGGSDFYFQVPVHQDVPAVPEAEETD
ncbi:MAG: hypothetical protein KA419_11230 [Acidobacteria bacterium]|nr:hypothetical protein [Acidobacteriota bacterium]